MGQLRVEITERDRRIEALEGAAKAGASSADVDAMSAKIADLEAKLKSSRADLKASKAAVEAAEASIPESTRRMNAWSSGSWKVGTTKLGTFGADHTDDLKVIKGIGPQMEELLQSFGIQSWEQLAAMDDDDVAKVDAALEDFPGRITRDEWVPQAKAIMENGHEVPKSAPKPKKKAKKPAKKKTSKGASRTGAWVKGTTKLGTAGAAHKDDLKVINGIGPKMEGILNGFGIQAWEQIATLDKAEVKTVDEALDFFHGRIERDEWVKQAGELCKRFPDTGDRPTRKTFLNRTGDKDPFS